MSERNKVMFVDDEEGVRVSWDRVLSDNGFSVKTAVDGATAISELQDDPVDVVVADLRMPGVDGLQLLEWIQGEQPETKFILLTGYGNDEVERKARELGAYGYLNKPISPETLSAMVTAAVNLKLIPNAGLESPVMGGGVAVEEAESGLQEAKVTAVTAEAEVARRSVWEVAGSVVVAPIMGLAFVLFLPVIGFGALFWSLGGAIKGAIRPSESHA